jgi:TonB family protein
VICLMRNKKLVLSFVLFVFSFGLTQAADDNTPQSLKELIIAAPKAELRDTFNDFMPVPTSKFKVDRQEIDTINTISIEDTVRYAPNVEVRRRYFGDPNGVISMLGNGNFQTARQMVFVDGFPLHSLLRTRFNGAPQWNFVAATVLATETNDPLLEEELKDLWNVYTTKIRQMIANAKTYPSKARDKGKQGKALVSFQIGKGGEIIKLLIESSSGHKVLDEAARMAVSNAEPFPPIPEKLNKQFAFLELPISFVLR